MQLCPPERVYGWRTAAPVKDQRTNDRGEGQSGTVRARCLTVPGPERRRSGERFTDPAAGDKDDKNPEYRIHTGGQE